MALQLPFLMHPKGVHWGTKGCISVIPVELAEGEAHGARYRGQGAGTQSWTQIAAGATAWRSCSYALIGNQPTFVMGGGWVEIGVIDVSHDGETWAQVYSQENLGRGVGVCNIVWDGATFHAMETGQRTEDTYWEGYILSSSNGSGWSTASSYIAATLEEFETKTAELVADFTALCPRGIPSGYFGYDADKDILMQPVDGVEITFDGVSIESSAVEIIGPEGSSTAAFGSPIRGISFAGGVWSVVTEQSTGPFTTAVSVWVSVDDGASWNQVYSTSSYVVSGIASGKESDFD